MVLSKKGLKVILANSEFEGLPCVSVVNQYV